MLIRGEVFFVSGNIMTKTFVINLASRMDRWEPWIGKDVSRWEATSRDEIDPSDPIMDDMISYHNIRHTPQHTGKIACFLSHTRLWRHIAENEIDDVLILEDDAIGMWDGDTSYLMDDGITYFGGFFTSPKIGEKLDRKLIEDELLHGINLVDPSKFRVMTTLAYYIPRWELAGEMFERVINQSRYRAIDVMLSKLGLGQYFIYPAKYWEKPDKSDIREDKKKFANCDYEFNSF